MSALILSRIDIGRNMQRFLRLDVQPDLCGLWCSVRESSRVGTAGSVQAVPFATEADARAAQERQLRAKERRGYRRQPEPGPSPG